MDQLTLSRNTNGDQDILAKQIRWRDVVWLPVWRVDETRDAAGRTENGDTQHNGGHRGYETTSAVGGRCGKEHLLDEGYELDGSSTLVHWQSPAWSCIMLIVGIVTALQHVICIVLQVMVIVAACCHSHSPTRRDRHSTRYSSSDYGPAVMPSFPIYSRSSGYSPLSCTQHFNHSESGHFVAVTAVVSPSLCITGVQVLSFYHFIWGLSNNSAFAFSILC